MSHIKVFCCTRHQTYAINSETTPQFENHLNMTRFKLLVGLTCIYKSDEYIAYCILLYNQIQIYFHIWLKISMKTKILLVGNAPLSLVNLYAQVTKKRPILY